MIKRSSGVLLPIFSLPSPHGIGCFSKDAYDFVDFLKKAGQTYWQILPIGVTGYGNSPYQLLSSFAGNSYFIDLDELRNEGLLKDEEFEEFQFDPQSNQIDYDTVYDMRRTLLRKAFSRSKGQFEDTEEYGKFIDENKSWIHDYALYMALRKHNDHKGWIEWDEDIRLRKSDAIKHYTALYSEDILYYLWQQFIFFRQWFRLKEYANENGVKIIGDIPIYVGYDSADCWAATKYFDLDENLKPNNVAGCPPDYFSPTGQMWGNPLYRWDELEKDGYGWWFDRIKYNFRYYDVIRIDHFRGFDSYYSIPAKDENAMNGVWLKGPGIDFFKGLEKAIGKREFIAEDLGTLTDSVKELVKETGFPGMKVLQFAFNADDNSDYLPHNYYDRNCVVYTGTHDNDTIRSWYHSLNESDISFVQNYTESPFTEETAAYCLITLAQRSIANLCVVPLQDYLNFGADARINTPGTLGNNWMWKLRKGEYSDELAMKMKKNCEMFRR